MLGEILNFPVSIDLIASPGNVFVKFKPIISKKLHKYFSRGINSPNGTSLTLS